MIRTWKGNDRKLGGNGKENDMNLNGKRKRKWYEVERKMKGTVRKMMRKWEEHDKNMRGNDKEMRGTW